MAVEVGAAYLRIIPSLKGISAAISGDLSSAGNVAEAGAKTLGSKMSNVFQGIFQGVGQAAFAHTMNLITGSLDSAIQRYDQLNQFPKVLQNLGFTSEQSAKATEALSKGLQGLPTPLQDATGAVQRFAAKNSDIEKSTKYYLAFNDALLAGGAPMQMQANAMEQLLQMYSVGKVDMMAWRSLQEAMPAQLKMVAESFGMTTDELYTGLQKGTITFEQFMGKIAELDDKGGANFASFAQQAKDSTGGVQTTIANMQSAITRGVAKLVEDFDKAGGTNAIKEFGKGLEQGLTGIAGALKWFIDHPKAGKAMLGIAAGVLALGAASKVMSTVQAIKAPFDSIIGGIKGLQKTEEAGAQLGKGNKGLGGLDIKSTLKSIASIAIIVVAIAGLALAFGKLPPEIQQDIIIGAQDLSQMALNLLPALLIFGIATAGLAILGKFANPVDTILALASLGLVITALSSLSIAMSLLPANLLIAGSALLSTIAINLIPALIIFGLATLGLAVIGLIPIPIILLGLAGLGLVIAGLIAFLTIAGALAQIPGLRWLIDEGGDMLKDVARILGEVIGSFVSAFGNAVSETLLTIMTSLADGIRVIGDAVSTLPADAGEKLSGLAWGMLQLAGGEFAQGLSGLGSWLLGGGKTPFDSIADGINTIKDALNGFSGDLYGNFTNAINYISDAVNNIPVIMTNAGLLLVMNTQMVFVQFNTALDQALLQAGDRVMSFTNWLPSQMNVNLYDSGQWSGQSWADGFISKINSINFNKSMNLNINVATSGETGLQKTTLEAIKSDIRRAVAGGAI